MDTLRRAPGGALILALVTTTVVGLAGAVVAYRLALGDPVERRDAAAVVPTAAAGTATTPSAAPQPRSGWAPCEPPAVLEDGVCVTDVVRTVTVSPPAAAAAAARQVTPPTPATGGEGRDDDGDGHDDSDGRYDDDDRYDDSDDRYDDSDDRDDDDSHDGSDDRDDDDSHDDDSHDDDSHDDDSHDDDSHDDDSDDRDDD